MSSYERELMSLGLGELSPDLFDVAPLSDARRKPPAVPAVPRAPQPSTAPELPVEGVTAQPIAGVEVPESPVSEAPALGELSEALAPIESLSTGVDAPPVDEAIDLSALLESLDRAHDEAPTEDSLVFDEFGSVELEDLDSGATLESADPDATSAQPNTRGFFGRGLH